MSHHEIPTPGDVEEPVSVPPQIIAGNVTSHMPRERIYDNREQRIVAGRLWLISFTDLFSILLCFFLMIFSMKDPDLDKIGKMMPNAKAALHPAAGKGHAGGKNTDVHIDRVNYGEAINLDYLQGVLKTSLTQAKLEKDVRISAGRDHLKLVVNADQLFAEGTVLSEAGEKLLKDLTGRLSLLSNRIAVVGIPSSGDSGDWRQTLAEASAVSDALVKDGYRKSFTTLAEAQGRGPAIEIRVESDSGRIR